MSLRGEDAIPPRKGQAMPEKKDGHLSISLKLFKPSPEVDEQQTCHQINKLWYQVANILQLRIRIARLGQLEVRVECDSD